MIIMCTDGLANIGLGNLDNPQAIEQSQKFYEEIANEAKERGILISVITIKGEGCKIETLAKVTELTNGTVERVVPEDISKNFGAILKDEIVGTQVSFEVRLHNALKFRNEEPIHLKENGSVYMKEVGNATISTEVKNKMDTKIN